MSRNMALAVLNGACSFAEDVRRFVKKAVEEEERAQVKEELQHGRLNLFARQLKIDLAEHNLTEDA